MRLIAGDRAVHACDHRYHFTVDQVVQAERETPQYHTMYLAPGY